MQNGSSSVLMLRPFSVVIDSRWNLGIEKSNLPEDDLILISPEHCNLGFIDNEAT